MLFRSELQRIQLMEKPPATDVIILLFVSENSLAQRKAVVYAITSHWEGDYLIPDLKLSDTTEYQIGKYGRMRTHLYDFEKFKIGD